MEKDTGYASAGLGSNHPEIKRREKEIQELMEQLSPRDIYLAKMDYARNLWQLMRNLENASFKAGNDKINVLDKKD